MSEPSPTKDIARVEPVSAIERRQALRAVPLGQMSRRDAEELRGIVVAQKANGRPLTDLCKDWPNLSPATIKRWMREASWERVDTRPEAIEAARERQATEIRALLDSLVAQFFDLEEAGDPDTLDMRLKISASIQRWQEREAKLLGLDRAIKVEHSGRIEMNHATAELEALVAELAGGGVLQTAPDEIIDADVVEP